MSSEASSRSFAFRSSSSQRASESIRAGLARCSTDTESSRLRSPLDSCRRSSRSKPGDEDLLRPGPAATPTRRRRGEHRPSPSAAAVRAARTRAARRQARPDSARGSARSPLPALPALPALGPRCECLVQGRPGPRPEDPAAAATERTVRMSSHREPCLGCGFPSAGRVVEEAHLTRLHLQLLLDTLGRPADPVFNAAVDRLIALERGERL